MKTRKLVLIIADLALLAVCIIQGIMSARDGAKYFEYKDEADEVTVTVAGETIHLIQDGEDWFINEQAYPAVNSTVIGFTGAMEYIRALDKVASKNDSTITKYELDDERKITVETKKAGKTLRTIEIGKEATASSQCYITVDGGKDIYLASGSLRTIFDKTIDDLRRKVVWGLEANQINSVSITKEDGSNFAVTRMGSGDDVVWNLNGDGTEGLEINSTTASDWFTSASIVTSTGWYSDSTKPEDLGGTLKVTAKVGYDYKTATISIYEIPAATEDGENQYYGTSSETPYVFSLASYQFEKFNKTPEEFTK